MLVRRLAQCTECVRQETTRLADSKVMQRSCCAISLPKIQRRERNKKRRREGPRLEPWVRVGRARPSATIGQRSIHSVTSLLHETIKFIKSPD